MSRPRISSFTDRLGGVLSRRSLAVITASGMAVSLAACAPGGGASSDDEVVVGVLAPVTGFMSTHGTTIRDSIKIAADEINKSGGIDGKKIKLVIADGASDPATNTQRARQLIGRDGAKFLIGTGSSAETLAAVTVATESKIPFIYSLDGEIKTCKPGDPTKVNPYVFSSGPTPQMLLGSFLPNVMKQSGKKVYFFGSDYVFPRSLTKVARGIVEDNGGTVLGEKYTPTDTTDYSAEIRAILKAKPEVLFLTLPGADGITFVRQARQAGVFDKMVVTGSATFDTENYSGFGKEADGVLAVNRYSELLDNPANKKYVAEYKKAYPNHKNPLGPTGAAGSYGALKVLAAAIDKAGTLDGAKVSKALEGLSIDLPQGTVTVDPQNHMFDQPLYQMKIENDNYTVKQQLGVAKHPRFEGCSVK
jgi:ABC-type branched-subunit amino acid transport system substrate-binding protein